METVAIDTMTASGSGCFLHSKKEFLGSQQKAARGSVVRHEKGKPQSPNNLLGRYVFPACDRLGFTRATWLTFRRTYSSWSHDKGVPDKVLAELMRHANVYTTLNVHTQVMADSLRQAVDRVGEELFATCSHSEGVKRVVN